VDGAALAEWIARERPGVGVVIVSAFCRAAHKPLPAHFVLEKPGAPSVVSNAVDLIVAAKELAIPLQ
jgi:hypothetical protein